MQEKHPKLNLGDENPLRRFQGSKLLDRNSTIRRKLAKLEPFPTAKGDVTNRFKGLKELLISSTKKSQDLESQTSIHKTKQSKLFKQFNHYQKIIYLLLEQPKSSRIGKLLLGAVFASILFNIAEAVISNPDMIYQPSVTLIFFERLALCIFILELALRLTSLTAFGDKAFRAVFKLIVLIDIICIFPFFVEISPTDGDFQTVTKKLRLLSLLKAMSVLKLLRYVKNASIFAKGVYQSLTSLLFLFLVIVVTTFIFSIAIYYVELSHPTSLLKKGIPTAIWWAIVTLSTVGYGDVVPKTVAGKVIGGIAGMAGMLLLALPVVILGYHFQEVYNDREDEKLIQKVKEKQIKIKGDMNHDQKEVYFLKRRIESIEGSNKKVMDNLQNSGDIYKRMSKDLKMLYKSIYAGSTPKRDKDGSGGTFTEKIKGMEKFRAAKKKIKLIHIFKQGIPKLNTERSSDLQLNREASGLRILEKTPISNILDELSDHDGLEINAVESLKKMSKLVSNQSPLLDEKIRKYGTLKPKNSPSLPQIVVDKIEEEMLSTPDDITGNNDEGGPLNIPQNDPNSLENMKLNLSLLTYSHFDYDDSDAYNDLASLRSHANRQQSRPYGATKKLLYGVDPFRRASAFFPSANSAPIVGNMSRVMNRASYFHPRSAFLAPRLNKVYSRKKTMSIENSSVDEGDSKGSSYIIDIPFKHG